jgi:hypothetical protein
MKTGHASPVDPVTGSTKFEIVTLWMFCLSIWYECLFVELQLIIGYFNASGLKNQKHIDFPLRCLMSIYGECSVRRQDRAINQTEDILSKNTSWNRLVSMRWFLVFIHILLYALINIQLAHILMLFHDTWWMRNTIIMLLSHLPVVKITISLDAQVMLIFVTIQAWRA